MEQLLSVSVQDAAQDDLDFPALSQNDPERTSNQLKKSDSDQERVTKITLTLLASSVPGERAAAARELGVLGGEAAVTHLRAALYDPSPEVCEAASNALAQLGHGCRVEPVIVLPDGQMDQISAEPVECVAEVVNVEPEFVVDEDNELSLEHLNAAFVESFGDTPFDGSIDDHLAATAPDINADFPVIDDEEFQAEAAAIRKAEHELALRRAEVEAKQRAREESARIARIETLKKKAEEEGRLRAKQEEKVKHELEEIRREQTEQLKRIEAAETERERQEEALRMFEADAKRSLEESERRVEEFQALKEVRASEKERRIENEKELKSELQQLEASNHEHQQLIALASASIYSKRESLKKLEAQLLENEETARALNGEMKQLRKEELAQQELLDSLKRSLAQLEGVRATTEAETTRTQERLNELNDRVDELVALEAGRFEKLAAAESRLAELDSERQQFELKIRRCEESEEQSIAALQALKQAETDSLTRIAKLEEQISELQSAANDNQQRHAELEVRERECRQQLDHDSEAITELSETLEVLNRKNAEQAARIAEIEKEGKQAQREANAQAEREESIRVELNSLRETSARSRELAEAFQLEVESELKLQTEQKEQLEEQSRQRAEELRLIGEESDARHQALVELESEAQAESAEQAQLEKEVNDNIERLLESSSKHQSQLESLREELSRLEIQEEQLKVEAENAKVAADGRRKEIEKRSEQLENEKIRAEHEQLELEELETTLRAAMDAASQRAQLEQDLTSQVDELNKAGLTQELAPPTRQAAVQPEGSFDFEDLLDVSEPQIEVEDEEQPFELETNGYDSIQFSSEDSMSIDDSEQEIESDSEPQSSTFVHEGLSTNGSTPSRPQETELVRSERKIIAAGEEYSVPGFLLTRLKDSDPSERKVALAELSQIGGDEAFSLISRAFDDSSLEVRNAAAHAMLELDRDRAASFTRVLRESTPERRRRIGAALGGSGIASDAINNLAGESREKTYDAFSILFLMAKVGEIQPLVRSIETHPDVDVRLAVISLLTLCNRPETIPAFRRLAVRGSLEAEIRAAVMEAIHQMSQNRTAAA